MRLILFADGAWAVNSLAELLRSGHTIVGVVLRMKPSSQDLDEIANGHGIPVLRPPKVNAPDFVGMVQNLRPDLGISIAYNQIFRRDSYTFLPHGLVNFHAGKLPLYRGRNVVNWAILNGETEIGLTCHFVDDGIDTGDIILQKTFPIHWNDGYGDVLCRIVSEFPSFVREAVTLIASGTFESRTQSLSEGTYFPGRGPDDEWLDWNDTSFNLYNKVRAITRPGPGARTVFTDTGAEVRIWRAHYDPSWKEYIATPGVTVGRTASGSYVKTSDSVLLVEEIEIQGKPPETAQWRLGTRLGLSLACLYNALRMQPGVIGDSSCSGNYKRF
jgi:methionyl-tRNA formyltransferase